VHLDQTDQASEPFSKPEHCPFEFRIQLLALCISRQPTDPKSPSGLRADVYRRPGIKAFQLEWFQYAAVREQL
jgi:hypothetical protein